MSEKLLDAELNAVWKAIEINLGLSSKDVAVVVRDDGKVEADCMTLKRIPEHSLRRMMEGRLYEVGDDNDKVYVEAKGVEEGQQLVLEVSDVSNLY